MFALVFRVVVYPSGIVDVSRTEERFKVEYFDRIACRPRNKGFLVPIEPERIDKPSVRSEHHQRAAVGVASCVFNACPRPWIHLLPVQDVVKRFRLVLD